MAPGAEAGAGLSWAPATLGVQREREARTSTEQRG